MEFLSTEHIKESLDSILKEQRENLLEGVCKDIFQREIEYQFLDWKCGALSEETFKTLSSARKTLDEMENRHDYLIVEKVKPQDDEDEDEDEDKEDDKPSEKGE